MTPSIQVLCAALWSGLAATALDRAKLFVSRKMADDSDVTPAVRHDANIRDAIGEYGKGSADGMEFGLAARINCVKVVSSRLPYKIRLGVPGVIGIRAYATDEPYSLAEPLSNALTAPITVSNFCPPMNHAKIEGLVEETL